MNRMILMTCQASPLPPAALHSSQRRSPSPLGKLLATLNELDLKCIAALTQSGAEDLVVRLPGKIALAKLLTDPEKM